MSLEEEIVKEGKLARIAGGLFFGSYLRRDVARLQECIRTAYDYAVNQPDQLQDFATRWEAFSNSPIRDLEHQEGDSPNTLLAKTLARLKILYGFDVAWVDSFFIAMLHPSLQPKTLADSLTYVHGSAETIGLMIASMLRLPKEARPAAQAQARAIQWITFVRDLGTADSRSAQFFPKEDLKVFGLKDLSQKTAAAKPVQFGEFIALQLSRYYKWQAEASHDIDYVPRRPRVALNTVVDGYRHTARTIAKNPLIIYDRQVTPSPARQLFGLLAHSLD